MCCNRVSVETSNSCVVVTGPPCSVEAVVRERDGFVGERIESARQDVLQTESLISVHIDLHNIPSRTL